MIRKTKKIIQLLVVASALGGGVAFAQETIPIEDIKPGMTGYGLTVFSGFKIERFKVRVIDVLKNFLPNQDVFLVRVDHPVLRKTGVVGGMSGSPIYLKGKLAGALGYGWRFSKEPIAGITPIKDMLALTRRKTRGPANAAFASAGPTQQALQRLARRRGPIRASDPLRWWRLPFPALARPADRMLVRASVPLSAAGFGGEAMTLLRNTFSAHGLEPMQGGGTGQAMGPTRFEPGSAVGIQMVSGDLSLTGTGTVTWVGKNQALGFGHRMFNAGEIYLQAVTARVNHTLASLARSFKIASPARPMGSLVQDRQAGILVDTSRKIPTVPMSVTMRSQGKKQVFRARVAHHRILTPGLALSVFSSALTDALADVTHATVKITTRIVLKGYPPLSIEDHLYASTGIRLVAVLFASGPRQLRHVMENPFEPVRLERVDMDVDVRFKHEMVQITGLRVSSSLVDPGDRINVYVTFRPFDGPEITRAYPITIPRSMAGSLLSLEAASGKLVRPDQADPENLAQLLRNIQESYPARSLVISLKTPTEGVAVRGRVIRDLPTSIVDTLNTGTNARSAKRFMTVLRRVHGTTKVVSGGKMLRIRVRPNEVNP